MSTAKRRWRLSFHRSSSSPSSPNSNPHTDTPPAEFLCPISASLMADPVIVSSGHTFESACVIACKNLGFTPLLPHDSSSPDFSTVIPNLALRSAILNWCNANPAIAKPQPLPYHSAEKLIRKLMPPDSKIQDPISNRRSMEVLKLQHSSASDESVASTSKGYSSSSSSSEMEIPNKKSSPSSPEEEELASKLSGKQVIQQEEGLIWLRKMTKTREDVRISLCTPRLLSSLKSLILSRHNTIQVNALASLVNISLETPNKAKILRSGLIPSLISVLRDESFWESQEHACAAIFSLSIDDDNTKIAIGVLGALPPLLQILQFGTDAARRDSAFALYHLSLLRANQTKLVQVGGVETLLSLAPDHLSLLVLCNLAGCSEGRAAMLECGAIQCFVRILREKKEGEKNWASAMESCVTALCGMCEGGGRRFERLARDAGVAEIMKVMVEDGNERMKDKARFVLEKMMKGKGRKEVAEWEELLELRSRDDHPGLSLPESDSSEF